MIEYEVVEPLWRCNKRELLPGAVTFILSLIFGVEIGLLAGVLTDIAFVVQRTARPGLSINKTHVRTGLYVDSFDLNNNFFNCRLDLTFNTY